MPVMLEFLWSKVLRRLRGRAIRRSRIHRTSTVEPGSHVVHTTMDRHSFCGYDCEIAHADIGSFCSIANGVVIGGGAHPIAWASTSPAFYKGRDSIAAKFSEHEREAPRRTTIGNDVWIGQRALIKAGVTIGTGAVVGMGSVVTRDIPPYTIVGGNPAKEIRRRFDEPTAQRLLASEWWTFSDADLRRLGAHVRDPRLFLDGMQRR